MPIMESSGSCRRMESSGSCRRMEIEAPHPLVIASMILMGALWAAMSIFPPVADFLMRWFALNTADFLARGRVWQAVTAIFLHLSLCHLLFNLIFLYLFGNALARTWRQREFLLYAAVCGVGANVCFWLFHAFRGESVIGLGASGMIFGFMGAYAIIYGKRIFLLFFVLPVQARILVAICAIIETVLLLSLRQDGISHATHLAGLAIGIVYVKLVHRRQDRHAGVSTHSGSTGRRLEGLEVMRDEG